MKRAEELLNSYKDSEALKLYEQVIVASPDNFEALCKASILHSRIGDRFSDETRKLEHFNKAAAYAQSAYTLQPKNAESNYAMAVALGAKAMVSGPKERLRNIHQMKPYVDAALQADSHHAGAWHVLGRWYFKMANLNFAERAACKMIFGGVAEEATNQKAAEAIEKAVSYAPGNISYYYDLACVYKEMKNTTACIDTLHKALSLSLRTQDELELSRRCNMMLQEQQKI
ncbi:hypothetical protein FJM65_13825 [Pontibacter mangrovi]|uniref:Tetratricopeptide repeat protein n=2 Tax=Pontibacter mangrovi TaxID=2589816 RepID=A0A501W545_9BACT|nr:hypothetical protein FJM65_13825 [Pontibacter mangrovi]